VKTLIGGVIDVETTGFSPVQDQVVELGLVLFACDRSSGCLLQIVDQYDGLREPSCKIGYGAYMAHGLGRTALQGCDLDYRRLEEMLEQAAFLIAHNASFDKGFVVRLLPAATAKPWYCSMCGIDWRGKGFSHRGLQPLLAGHGIDPGQAHRALDDARATLQLISCRQANGDTYLSELLDLQGPGFASMG
jgi:DNA polymerase-3 subunit epsilon